MFAAQAPDPHDTPWGLSGPVLDRFLGFCQKERRLRNHLLCRPGEDPGNLVYLIRGEVSVYSMGECGRELALGEFRSGDFLGEIGFFHPTGPREVYIRAKTPVEYACIDMEHFRELMKTDLAQDAPHLLYALGNQLARRLLDTRRRASSLALMDVESRIRRALWELHVQCPYEHPEGPAVKVSRKDLASRVGCTREVSGRVIKRLAKEGWLQDYGKILVLRGN